MTRPLPVKALAPNSASGRWDYLFEQTKLAPSTSSWAPHDAPREHDRRAKSPDKAEPFDSKEIRQARLLQRARATQAVARDVLEQPDGLISREDPRIRTEILLLIEQYLNDQGLNATKVVLHDEAALKGRERDERTSEYKRLKRCILEGDWAEADQLLGKPMLRTQKALMFCVFKQQFLELIEHRETQKALNLLTKRLKPLEHYQSTPNEFRSLSYLLSAKSVHEDPAGSFRDWEGILPGREKLVAHFGHMLEVEKLAKDTQTYIPSRRLEELLDQAAAYQIQSCRHRTAKPRLTSLLYDYTSFILPNSHMTSVSGHTQNVKCVAFLGESGANFVSGSSDTTIKIWDTDTLECIETFVHGGRIWSVDAFQSASVSVLASAGSDKTVKLWQAGSATPISCLNGHRGDVYSLAFHPGGASHIVTGGYDKVLRLFDSTTADILRTFSGHLSSVSSVVFNGMGNLIVSGSKDSSVRVWDCVSGLCVKTINQHLGEVTSVRLSDDGISMLSASKDNTNRLWDTRMLRALPLRRFKGHSNVGSRNFIRASFLGSSLADGTMLVASGSEDGSIYMWDASRGGEPNTVETPLQALTGGHQGACYQAAWNAKSSLLLSCGDDGNVGIWQYSPNAQFDFE
ncbi:uncharacterized protein L969DRAFT_83284 [Mixia osmundae IAM 14324]|uniref:CTLH domain-containing protein n=1 Tax=Mixia osmundae (strain CBS 9802 / IAM 14324 / JCM 22182 / KY 12970) TaxID=764103 RepID=G7E248_MIXOS|nr:uncharacterized protein L969DRAFT_83284 [Mixia osmundae IAM 14324]KEI36780.1 hypothetical protein L969DRAFT_83284 [Mixia osmundae IAM 14324]GAA96908.1 hypothetical protein E5Q_03582 [Mixia osmundae IAM 14324]